MLGLTAHQHVKYRNGLATSYEKTGSFYNSLEDIDMALKYFENYSGIMKELSELSPQNVRFKNDLSVSYTRIGMICKDKKLAKYYFNSAKKFWEDLIFDFPDNDRFQNDLNWVINVIGNLG